MSTETTRCRLRDLGVAPGVLPTGCWNAITDVAGVRVGHATVIEGEDVRTGVTAVLAHDGNSFRERVPAGVVVGNGFGKLIGFTQVRELGELETPILLTNTLAAPRVADALIDWILALPGNEDVTSVNPFVGETNDGRLNDIRARGVRAEHVHEALAAAQTAAPHEPVAGGNVGAGTGTVAFGYKGGIGTASRVLPAERGGWTVGALVQANFGGVLSVDGLQVGKALGGDAAFGIRGADTAAPDTTEPDPVERGAADGSIMIVLATDAPLSDRNLERLATRGLAGLARTGAAMSDGSGDYAVAFSTAPEVRRRVWASRVAGALASPGDSASSCAPRPRPILDLPNEAMSPLFLAAIEATEEAILDALCLAETMRGSRGRVVEAIPLDVVRELVRARNAR
ncbi:MAG: P1 family peptidase [Trueperaceae bacterium]